MEEGRPTKEVTRFPSEEEEGLAREDGRHGMYFEVAVTGFPVEWLCVGRGAQG